MAKDANLKTNAMRILDQKKIPYQTHFYEHPVTDKGELPVDGVTVASLLGQDPAAVFKTLVTRGAGGNYFVFVIPVAAELDRKAAARSVDEKSVELIPVKELLGVTGYVRGGCSPVGLKKPYRVTLDESALVQPSICVSAGRIGAQVELAPGDLLRAVNGRAAALTMKDSE